MNKTSSAVAVTLMALVALALATPAAGSQRSWWWKSGEIRAELQITDGQSATIDALYTASRPIMRSLMKALEQEEEALSRLIADMNVAEWELALQIDQVEAARSALSKERTLLLYRMRKELTAEQRAGLKELQDRRRRERESGRSSPCH